MINKLNNNNKQTGDELSAQEWNQISGKVDELVEAYNTGGNTIVIDSSNIISTSSKGNVTLGSPKNVNIEPAWDNNVQNYSGNYGDIALKPGDDILFCSHHREPNKRDKIVLKTIDGEDNPVKFEIHTGEISLNTKNKSLTKKKNNTTGQDTTTPMFKIDDAKVLDVKILTGTTLDSGTDNERDERGYLKVRAQAIDLRCEKHGGISLLPKGYDGDGNMNKIKFEHGGGDGLEFGTFNTEKTSIFTDEYRFNRNGIWKMATREKVASGKTIIDEKENGLGNLIATAAYKYQKQADDFYDIIDVNDEQCTTKDIIKTAYAFNGAKDRHAKVTNSGAIEIATNETYLITLTTDNGSSVNVNTISSEIASLDTLQEGEVFNEKDFESLPVNDTVYTNGTQYFTFTVIPAPNIKIDSGAELKLGGILDFGSSFNFGETDNGIEVLYKLTKKNATKDCGILKVVGVNNHSSNNLTLEGVTIAPGNSEVIAQCSILDIIKLVNYFKTGAGVNNGPWAVQL